MSDIDSTVSEDYQQRAAQRARTQHVRIRQIGYDAYATTSRSDASVQYSLHVGFNGDITCSCPGFHHYLWCKHAEQLRRHLERKQRTLE